MTSEINFCLYFRLEETWELVGAGLLSKYEEMKELFSAFGNFSAYRKWVSSLANVPNAPASSLSPSLSLPITHPNTHPTQTLLNHKLSFSSHTHARMAAYLGPLFRDLIYFHDSLPTFVGPNHTLLNISKVCIRIHTHAHTDIWGCSFSKWRLRC